MTGYQAAAQEVLDGGHNSSAKCDPFSPQQRSGTSSPDLLETRSRLRNEPAPRAPSYALPTNLSSAVRYLDNDQLVRLLSALLAEQQARGRRKLVPRDPTCAMLNKNFAPPMAQGKLNAVRAAFKAGVTPSQIARQFGVSRSDVGRALASDPSK
jgi:hypothetical protein